MLRARQHERKDVKDGKPWPFVMSHVEGLRQVFLQLWQAEISENLNITVGRFRW
jgi:hypothetical protein